MHTIQHNQIFYKIVLLKQDSERDGSYIVLVLFCSSQSSSKDGKMCPISIFNKTWRGSLVDKVKRITKDSSTGKILHFFSKASKHKLFITHWKEGKISYKLMKML